LTVGLIEPHGHRFQAFGQVARNGQSEPPGEDTLFEIGSITKTFTATLLAVLVTEGRVQLDDPANRYLKPEWRLPDDGPRTITLAELATHTSGLPVQPPLIGLFALSKGTSINPYSKFDGPALADALKNLKLAHPIGEKYEYSNLGCGLLGHALVGATQSASFEELLRERVLRPLQLTDTAIALSADQSARLAQPHSTGGQPTPAWDFATLEACGGLRSTSRDMLRWVEAHLGRVETPLRPALQLTHQRRFPAEGSIENGKLAMGLGWHLIPIPNRAERAVFHNGGTYGSRSFAAFVPAANVGVVILSNSGNSVDELGLTLLQRLLEHHAPQSER
jgi:CubicO group peptidase (beta-lactamase class C family)